MSIRVALLLSCVLAAGRGASAAPETVAVYEPLEIATAHPYVTDGSGWRRVIRFPGATFVRIHFSVFDLAEGDWLEVSGRDGSAVHAYTGRGPHRDGEFWAHTVPGEAAYLTLHASSGEGYGLEIDGAGRGTVDLFSPDSEPTESGAICGTNEWKDARCYETSRPVEYENSRATALVLAGCCGLCSGFKVSDTGQFLTSSHCGNGNGARDIEVLLEHQATGCNTGDVTFSGALMGLNALAYNRDLDYVLFNTAQSSPTIPCLQLDQRMPAVGERIYIAHQPDGTRATKLSVESDQDVGGFCAVEAAPLDGVLRRMEIGHRCDTLAGSLGAPIISGVTHRVVGIQHIGNCPSYNRGTRMDLIYKEIAGIVESCGNGVACEPQTGGRCDCDGACTLKESRYVERGGVCADCP